MNDELEPTFNVMKELLLEVKKEHGTDAAKAIIKTVGRSELMADISPERFNDVVAACKARMAVPVVEEEHPLDHEPENEPQVSQQSVDPRTPPLSDAGLQVAIEAIDKLDLVSENKVTVEEAIRAVWAAWLEQGLTATCD